MVHILERCNGKPATMHAIESSGWKLNQKCRINTDKISIRPHLNTRIETSEIIELSKAIDNLTLETHAKTIREIPDSIDLKSDDNILVQNHNNEYSKLIAKTDKIIEENNYKTKIDELRYGKIWNFIIWNIGIIYSYCLHIINDFFCIRSSFMPQLGLKNHF